MTREKSQKKFKKQKIPNIYNKKKKNKKVT